MHNTLVDAVTLLPQLPCPPKELTPIPNIESLFLSDGATVHQVGTYYQMNKIVNSVSMKCCKPASLRLLPDCVSWIQKRIVPEFINSRLNFYIPLENTCDSTGIHTDLRGDYALLYNLDTGGDSAKLTVWQEPQCPLYREPALTHEDPKSLTVLSEFLGPANCWYLINLRALHSVENIARPRINIQIKLETQQLQLIKT